MDAVSNVMTPEGAIAFLVVALAGALAAGAKKVIEAMADALVRRAKQLWLDIDEDESTAHLSDKDKTAIVVARAQPNSLLPKGVIAGAIEKSKVEVREGSERPAPFFPPESG